MKTHLCFSITVVLLLVGCGDKSGQTASGTNSATSDSVASAPADYLRAVVKDERDAVKTIDTTSLDKAISILEHWNKYKVQLVKADNASASAADSSANP